MVGSTREQNGHWKSENSITVTLAVLAPRAGELPTGTLYTDVSCSGTGGRASASFDSVLALRVRASYTCEAGTPAESALLAAASSSSITFLNASIGWAPASGRPLMKNDGVPRAPSLAAWSWSALMAAEYLLPSSASLALEALTPSSCAYLSSDARSSACWFLNSLS